MQLTKADRITIVIPKEATPREQFAAEELQKYLALMLDNRAAICDDTACRDGFCFLIGGPERNRQSAVYLSEAAFHAAVPGPEGMLLRAVNAQTVLIAGSSWHEGECERGTIYGVYELLERYCGCVLAAYSHPDADAGEIVPRKDVLTLKDVD